MIIIIINLITYNDSNNNIENFKDDIKHDLITLTYIFIPCLIITIIDIFIITYNNKL